MSEQVVSADYHSSDHRPSEPRPSDHRPPDHRPPDHRPSDHRLPEHLALEELTDEREVLLGSIEDLEREHDAGDLSEADYVLLKDRYTVRAAEVLRAIEQAMESTEPPPSVQSTEPLPASVQSTEPPPSVQSTEPLPASVESIEPSNSSDSADQQRSSSEPGGENAHDGPGNLESVQKDLRSSPSGRRRRILVLAATAAVAVVAAASILLVIRGTTTRLPGETETGSLILNSKQQLRRTLAQAETLESQGNAAAAIALYHQVLSKHPDNEQALAESGWLEYEAGVTAKNPGLLTDGQTEELKAQDADPGDYAPHLYLGSMFLVEGEDPAAVSEFRTFLSDNPPHAIVVSAEPFIVRAFEADHLTPPSSVTSP